MLIHRCWNGLRKLGGQKRGQKNLPYSATATFVCVFVWWEKGAYQVIVTTLLKCSNWPRVLGEKAHLFIFNCFTSVPTKRAKLLKGREARKTMLVYAWDGDLQQNRLWKAEPARKHLLLWDNTLKGNQQGWGKAVSVSEMLSKDAWRKTPFVCVPIGVKTETDTEEWLWLWGFSGSAAVELLRLFFVSKWIQMQRAKQAPSYSSMRMSLTQHRGTAQYTSTVWTGVRSEKNQTRR